MPDPNNILLRDHGIVFMLLPKVANTSIKFAIAQALGLAVEKIHSPDLFEYISSAEARAFPHRIAFVRDPLTRLLSCYRDKVIGNPGNGVAKGLESLGIKQHMPFLQFVEAVADLPDQHCHGVGQHFRSQSYSLVDADGVIPNRVGRFESLHADWQRVCDFVQEVAGLQLPPLGHHCRTNPGLVQYCPRGRAFALQRYREDVRIFGYAPARKYPIDPDAITVGRSICNVLREAYQVARDQVPEQTASARLCDLIAEAFDMGKRMNNKLRGSQYEA